MILLHIIVTKSNHMDCLEAKTVPSLLNQHKIISMTCIFGGCPDVPVHGGIPIVFISIHGVLT